jgi:hypothetical protein
MAPSSRFAKRYAVNREISKLLENAGEARLQVTTEKVTCHHLQGKQKTKCMC